MAILIGPMDYFRHGHYYEEYDFTQIAEEDWKDQISLENEAYEMEFSPIKYYLNGFSIFLYNQPEDNEGSLVLTITDEKGKVIDSTKVDLSKPQAGKWYKTYIDSNLKKDKVYKLQFTVHDCKYYPYLQNVDDDYLPEETQSGSILIAYSYAQPTFTFQERSMIVLLILALILMLIGGLIPERKKILNSIAIVIFLTLNLSWNYMHNSMDNANTSFDTYQHDSEGLTSSVIYAEEDGIYFSDAEERGYGLGRYYDLKGAMTSYNLEYTTDEDWNQGYSRTIGAIFVSKNPYSEEVIKEGNSIKFSNGEMFQITNVEERKINETTWNYIVYLNTEFTLSPLKYGSLDNAEIYNSNGDRLSRSKVTAYASQYGLQGKIFRHLARYMETENEISNLNLICSILTASIFVLIVFIISQKYNKLMAGVYYVTFWLSPWIVNFARNTYWVEFTWFIPMLIGLLCSWKINRKECRLLSYFLAYISVLVKSLCGYEYISVIMMALIAFLIVDLIISGVTKNKEMGVLQFKAIVIIGVAALAGFMTAICIHASLKGQGNILEGISEIIEKDVLRRTTGADYNDYEISDIDNIWVINSFNASVWAVYNVYFKFSTEIITGIPGNLFPLTCIIPLILFVGDYYKKKVVVEHIAMYVAFFLTSISWFCLAKAHSYVHIHMNYVLWYFGFIQTCFYVIVDRIVKIHKKNNMEKSE
ncbi:hypothetical protein [Pseudobutyrivibrio sp. YE44]|uniref:hypothetical protein n=1 Tax=Pseudobutyrivibrio sp. YE44 TaxID=1520802 RepID=UPI00115FF459|nr:hypothetical protein [Pseudobutyrivibrio sp. YE44]